MNILIQRTVMVLLAVMLLAGITSAQGEKKYETPILVTSAGQSADVTLASMLFKRANLTAKAVAQAKAGDLDNVKTLVVVPGFSSKGLGAAGISREDEMKRVKQLLDAAAAKKIPVLMMHIGGKPRRGQQSDDFCRLAAEAADHLIVVKQGDEDGFFSGIAKATKKPIELVDKIADAAKPVAALFQ
ncbi:MAG: DUF6305 family protein [Bacteroidetes bacterium]|jgi:hypothetical protein|nr:DUF6305 family protein [Bacteroidota bacterium]